MLMRFGMIPRRYLCTRVDVVASFGVDASEGKESHRDRSRYKRADECVPD
jgi:hypothetical protein